MLTDNEPIEAHDDDKPWGFCPCGWMVWVDHAFSHTCTNCGKTRIVNRFSTRYDWERIHNKYRERR